MKRLTTLLFVAAFALGVNNAFATLNTPTITAPTVGATNRAPDVLLNWSNSTSATAYQYKLSTSPTLAGAVAQQVSVSQVNCANLLFGTTYYWSVRAIKTGGSPDSSAWSAIWNFSTINQVTLSTPGIGANNQAPNATLTWTAISGLTNYDVQYDTSASFNSPFNTYFSVAGSSATANCSNLMFGQNYYWRVRGRHSLDTTLWSTVRNFSVLDEMILVLPANNATNVSINPTMKWVSVAGSTGYQYRYSTFSNMSNAVLMQMPGSTVQDTLYGLTYGTTYYWQVRVYHSLDTSSWCSPWAFTTQYQLTSAPTLVSPANSSTNVPLSTVNFTWNASTGATSYQYEYADNSSFTNSVLGNSTPLTHVSGTLLASTTYYWRVRGSNGNGYSPWSNVWSFATVVQYNTAPTLISPPDLTVNVALTGTTLTWSSVYAATQYYYEFDTHSNFSAPIGGAIASPSAITGPLGTNTIYFWRIKAGNGTIWSPWSSVWKFSTGPTVVGVDENTLPAFNAYPNPCNGTFTLNTGLNSEPSRVIVCDLSGKVVFMNNALVNAENTLDLGSVKPGSYLLSVENSSYRKCIPLIVE
ncbi:MAG: T9SS type A sorting domain-containing protein [Bacteroidota bacterium]